MSNYVKNNKQNSASKTAGTDKTGNSVTAVGGEVGIIPPSTVVSEIPAITPTGLPVAISITFIGTSNGADVDEAGWMIKAIYTDAGVTYIKYAQGGNGMLIWDDRMDYTYSF